ncbi:MAG: DUF4230 domain-containing protein [Oscillospiraceae bacterium]|nr:DUF4230 domain-containing protein [Oscillospiraceae bacterium]
MTVKTKTGIYIGLILAVIAVAVGLIIWHGGRQAPAPAPAVTPPPTPEVVIREKEVEIEKIVEVEKEITAATIQDGLRDMGFLVTEEYYFTEVVSYSSIKTLFDWELGITESRYLVSYDGVVTAGIDFAGITVTKDTDDGLLTVTLPRASIRNIDIDMESFELYTEKEGWGNPISVADYNQSLVELEKNAENRALDRGILDRAGENAVRVIDNFIKSLMDTSGYTIRYDTVG